MSRTRCSDPFIGLIVGPDLDEKFISFDLNYILNEMTVHIEQRFKTMEEFRYVELLNLKLFLAYEKNPDGNVLNFGCI